MGALPPVRDALLDFQRDFAANPPGSDGPRRGAILDGRDIGTVVCPDAEVKFFVTASDEERARRRHAEFAANRPSAIKRRCFGIRGRFGGYPPSGCSGFSPCGGSHASRRGRALARHHQFEYRSGIPSGKNHRGWGAWLKNARVRRRLAGHHIRQIPTGPLGRVHQNRHSD